MPAGRSICFYKIPIYITPATRGYSFWLKAGAVGLKGSASHTERGKGKSCTGWETCTPMISAAINWLLCFICRITISVPLPGMLMGSVVSGPVIVAYLPITFFVVKSIRAAMTFISTGWWVGGIFSLPSE